MFRENRSVGFEVKTVILADSLAFSESYVLPIISGRKGMEGGWEKEFFLAYHNPITKELTLIKFCFGDHCRNFSKSCFVFVM